VKNNSTDADKQKDSQSSGLKIAGSGPGSGKQDEGIEIMMSMDKDEMTRKAERDAEAAAKRQQNALPAWHLKSTISGHLTALGVKETARNAAAAGSGTNGVVNSFNDEILRGLGTVGSARSETVVETVVEEVKPVVNADADCVFLAGICLLILFVVAHTFWEQTTISTTPR
jgi:transcription initiation factor TFIIE subunit alpha